MSDHIPDLTKMIGETPRTNLEAFFPHESMYQVCDADFTRQLERGLTAANERIKRLEEMYEGEIGENEQFLGSNLQGLLIRELNWSKERIKRLEEAGDKLEYASVISEAGEDPNGFEKLLIAQREWRKAKEDKL